MISDFFRKLGMKNRFLILAAFFFLTDANIAGASNEMVKVGIYDIEPLCETAEMNEGSGFFVEILKFIAREEHWDLQFVSETLKGCLEKLARGEIDLLVAADYSNKNKAVFDFNREAVISTWGQLFGPVTNRIGSLLDLSGSTVGVVRDDPYNQGLRELLKGFNITSRLVEFNHSSGVFDALEKGWVDAGVVDRLFGAKHQGSYRVKKTPIVLTPVELRFAVPKGENKFLTEALDYHLKKTERMTRTPFIINWSMAFFNASPNFSISPWLIWGIGIAILVAVIAGGISLFLKRQVRAKTDLLVRKNEAL